MVATTLISTIPTLPSSHRSSKHRARRPSTALALVSTEGTEEAGRRVSELRPAGVEEPWVENLAAGLLGSVSYPLPSSQPMEVAS